MITYICSNLKFKNKYSLRTSISLKPVKDMRMNYLACEINVANFKQTFSV